MSVSEDPSTGTNQKTAAFWSQIYSAYNANVDRANKNRQSDPDWKKLHIDRSPALLKGQWYLRMQPAIQKFCWFGDQVSAMIWYAEG